MPIPDPQQNEFIAQPLDITHHDTLERHRIEQTWGVPSSMPPGMVDLGSSPIPARADHQHAASGAYSFPVLYYLAGPVVEKDSLPFHVNKVGYTVRRWTVFRLTTGAVDFTFQLRRLGQANPIGATQTLTAGAQFKIITLQTPFIVPFDPASEPNQFFAGIFVRVLPITGNAGNDALWTVWFDFAPAAETGVPSTSTVTNLNPNTGAAGTGAATVTITGTNFTNTTVVVVDGTIVPSTFVSVTQMTTTFFAGYPLAGVFQVGVRKTGEKTSNTLLFTVT